MSQTTTATVPTATTPTASAAGTRKAGRGSNATLWALQVLTAAVFVMAAIPKVTADPMAVAGFAAMGFGPVGMYTIGGLEIAGAVALLIPILAGLAALAFVGLMIGAVLLTLATMGAGMVALPAVVLVVAAVIAWGRRRSTHELVALARRYAHR